MAAVSRANGGMDEVGQRLRSVFEDTARALARSADLAAATAARSEAEDRADDAAYERALAARARDAVERAHALARAPWSRGRSMRVVLVDDSEPFRHALAEILGATGHEVVAEARHGGEGVELVLTLQPDVVVMDWQMPEMNGVEATSQIRGLAPDVVVIAATANPAPEVAEAFLAAGARACVDKMDVAALPALLRDVDRVPLS
jgi:CheY-like chemotaxis protein